jgi:hypothetical protein
MDVHVACQEFTLALAIQDDGALARGASFQDFHATVLREDFLQDAPLRIVAQHGYEEGTATQFDEGLADIAGDAASAHHRLAQVDATVHLQRIAGPL